MANISKKIVICFIMIVCVFVLIITACSTKTKEVADLVVYGTTYTAEKDNDGMAEAFAVKDGKFIFVGDKEGAKAFVKEGVTKIVENADSGLIIPGCTEGHGHFIGIDAIMKLLPGYNYDYDKLLVLVKDMVAANKKPEKIATWGWSKESMLNYDLKEKTYAKEIENIAEGIPVVLIGEGGHMAMCNITALKKAGVWDKPIVAGGTIVTNDDNEPIGLISDEAVSYVFDRAIGTPIPEEQFRLVCHNAVDELHRRGFTNYFDGYINAFDDNTVYKYINELDNNNDLNMNISTSFAIRRYDDEVYKERIDHVAELADKYHSTHFDPRNIKLFSDGVVEMTTGWVLGEYRNVADEDKHGNIIWTQEKFNDLVEYANSKNLLVHTHAYGDGACNATINAYVKSNETFGKKIRNSIGHARNILKSDIDRIAENGIGVAENLIWHYTGYNLDDQNSVELVKEMYAILPEGYENGYPMKSFLNKGVKMSSSTDAPCSEAIEGNIMNIIEVSTTGIAPNVNSDAYYKEELISTKEAIDCLTINGAWQMGIEDRCGSIKVGKNADFVILDKNILNYKNDDLRKIHNTNVLSTYFEGKEVYKK